jgi:hypothetical protein
MTNVLAVNAIARRHDTYIEQQDTLSVQSEMD